MRNLRSGLFPEQKIALRRRDDSSSDDSSSEDESDILDRLHSSCSETELSSDDDNWCHVLVEDDDDDGDDVVDDVTDIESDFEDVAESEAEDENCESEADSCPSWYYDYYPKR